MSAEAAAQTMPHDDAESPAPLALDNIDYTIGRQRILRNVSLSVHKQEIVCLLGASGCGKTTLLRIAAGIERQTRGRVSVGGALVADERNFLPAEKRPLGLVFQDLALFPHMRVIDNVAYGAGTANRSEAYRRAEDALAQVGLNGYGQHFPHQLSGGEQQRVALVRALLPAPEVVLFDEPFSGLDRNLRNAVREDVLSVLRARNATAVMVTHDPEEALAAADRIALMREGVIVQVATPEEIWRWPVDLEAARMFGTVNSFESRVVGGVAETPIGRIPVGRDRDGAVLTVGFRPEALKIFPAARAGGVLATIRRRRFFGGHVELVAEVGQSTVQLRSDPYEVPHDDAVRLVPDLRQAIVFEHPQLT